MYEISFYEDEKGNSDIKELIEKLRDKSKKDKDARINYHKIVAYIDLLEEYGTGIGEPVTKHLLHHFTKKTRKTPKREIEKAKREIEDYKRRRNKL